MSILAFSGSSRHGSINQAVLDIAVKAARAAGASVTSIVLRDFDLPIYDGDLEASKGLPEAVTRMKAIFKEHSGLLIACPEYNSSITPLLKNAIDWVSRPAPNEAPLGCFDGKHAGLVAASGGALGGLRGLFHVRDILQNIRVTVLPDPYMVAVGKATELLSTDGTPPTPRLKDERLQSLVEGVGRRVAEVTKSA